MNKLQILEYLKSILVDLEKHGETGEWSPFGEAVQDLKNLVGTLEMEIADKN